MASRIPPVLPIIALPPGQVLLPSLILSLRIARPESVNVIKHLLRDAEDRPGNPALLLGCVPLKAPSTHKETATDKDGKTVVKKPDPYRTPPSSDDEAVAKSPSARPGQNDLFEIGTAARIVRLERLPNSGGFLAVVEGLTRIQLTSFVSGPSSPFHEARVTPITSLPLPDDKAHLLPPFQKLASELLVNLDASGIKLSTLVTRRIRALVNGAQASSVGPLIDVLFGHIPLAAPIPLKAEDQLAILAAHDTAPRLELALELLSRINESLGLQKRLGEKVDANLSRRQREFLLLQQLQAIRQELEELAANDPKSAARGAAARSSPLVKGGKRSAGPEAEDEEEDEEDDLAELAKQIKAKSWSEEAGKVAKKEFKRLKKTPPQGAEYGVIRNYLDWLLAIPWNEATSLPLSADFISAARIKLDEDHYGLEKIKKRLLEWLAVLRLKQEHWIAENEVESALPVEPTITPPTQSTTEVVLRDPSMPPAPSEPALPPLSSTRTPKPRDKGPILLLCGPPGTGKTSIAKSLAEAMGRKFYRISLGGIRDEAEIRGHRRTYVAALPGALAMALRKTGVNNPVILLDEIDKIGMASTHGDPAAALLETLDPEQNWNFTDHYLGVPLDLSSVLFIATANQLDTISAPLYDRMEVIELSGYVHDEKLHIARQYLIPKQLTANQLPPWLFEISDPVLLQLITSYTREAGVRTTERELGSVIRAKAVEYSEAKDKGGDLIEAGYKAEVAMEDLERILGVPRYDAEELDRENMVGVATGLSYQGSGNGGILHIETSTMPGSGGFQVTGQLGEVISESATLALAWVKSHAFELGISSTKTEDVFSTISVHLHLPSGSIRKDGPSAGVAFTVALVSLMRGIRVRKGLAMTGEITLRGNVTPVGGIKEKVLGAHRAGITSCILPYKNEKDVSSDLPASVKEQMTFIYVRSIWEALDAAFGPQLWEGVDQGRRAVNLLESRL